LRKIIVKMNIFNINEHSKNDPIPEINRENKLSIILLGAPGVGKSTFITNNILSKNRNIKIFSTDDISLTFTKDPNVYKSNSSELNIKRLMSYIKTGRSYIYDTTGTQKDNITNVILESKKYDYTIILIQIMGTLDLSIKQNKMRNRTVPFDYIKLSYDKQYMNMKYFASLDPNNYYIVYNLDGKYKYMKYDGDILYKRKVDKYVDRNNNSNMKVKKFNEVQSWDIEEDDPNDNRKTNSELINGSGLFFFLSNIEDDKKIQIIKWYKSLSQDEQDYVDILRSESSDETDYFHNDDC